jgi:signal transduction histidine kinase
MDERDSCSRQPARAIKDNPLAKANAVMYRDAHARLAEKMEAVGMLARGIAHDFNNILSGVLGFASYLKAKAQTGSEIHRDLSLIEQSAIRAAELTDQLFLRARRRNFTKSATSHRRAYVKLHIGAFSRHSTGGG